MTPLVIGVVRLAVAAVVLALLARLRGPLSVARADVGPCIAMGACMAVFQAGYFTAVVGRLPRVQSGALVWYGLGGDQPLTIDPAALTTCASTSPKALGLLVPDCVLRAGKGNTRASR